MGIDTHLATIAQSAHSSRASSVPLVPPKLYLNGFPKSGLHLAEQMAYGMLEPLNHDYNWFGTNAWGIERHSLEEAALVLGGIRHGAFLKGHMGYLPSLEALFVGLGIGMVFIYRDLRDVIVSQAYHIRSSNKDLRFPHRAEFTGMDFEDTMIAVIEGLGGLESIFTRWDTYSKWLDCEWVLPMKFEQLRNRSNQAVTRFFDYVYHHAMGDSGLVGYLGTNAIRNAATSLMLQEMGNRSQSVTFRKGKTGEWKREFTPAVTKAFKENGGDWLQSLGYEKDGDW